MNVKILGLVQDFSFETGETQNFLKLQLPDGVTIHSAVDEQVALASMRAFVEPSAATTGAIPEEQLAHSAKLAREYSGGETAPEMPSFRWTDGEQPHSFSPVRLEDEPLEEFAAAAGEIGQPGMPVPQWSNGPVKTQVTANAAGYPVRNDPLAVDMGEVVGSGEPDEDGVGGI